MAASADLKIQIPDDLVQRIEEEKYESLVRESVLLEAEDIVALQLEGPSRSQDSGLKHLRAFHHNIALRLATGERPVSVCAVLGLSPQTITKLANDSQFQALVEGYRDKLVQKGVDHFELMGLVGAESLTALLERLTGDGRDDIGLEQLRKIAETAVDRIGHAPVRRSEALSRVTHELSRETLDRIKALHSEDNTYEAQAIEATVVSHEEESQSAGAGLSIASAFGAVQEATVTGPESPGHSLPEESSEVSEA